MKLPLKLSLRTISLALTTIALLAYLLLSYVFLKHRDFVDEPSMLLHKFISTSPQIQPMFLRYPIGLYPLTRVLSLHIGFITLVTGCLSIILMYFLTLRLTGDPLKAGLSTVVLSTTAGFLYWFKFNTYGSYVLLPIWLLTLLLLMDVESRFKIYTLVGVFVLNGLLWLTSVFGWITLLFYSIYLSTSMFQGTLNRKYLLVGLVLLASTLPLNVVSGLKYVTELHVFSVTLLIQILVLYAIVIRSKSTLNPLASLLLTIAPYVISLSIVASGLLGEPPGLVENYVKKPTPLIDYGIVGLLVIPTLIYIVKNKPFKPDYRGLTIVSLIALFVLSLCLSYRSAIYSLIAVTSFTPVLSFSLVDLFKWVYGSIGTRSIHRYMAVTWLIVGILSNNLLLSLTALSVPPSTVRLDLPEVYYRMVSGNESAIMKAFEKISQRAVGKVAVLCYWDYVYYAKGVLGDKIDTRLYSNIDEYKRFFSQVLLSEEGVAYGLIKNHLEGLNDTEVYIIVVELISFEGRFNESKIVDVGLVGYAESLTRPGFYDRTYWVFSDIGRIYVYTQFGGLNYSNYIFPMVARVNEMPLSWSDDMGDTLLVKLLTHGLTSRGYEVYNYVKSKERPLQVTLTTGRFELVDVVITPLFNVKRQIGAYTAEHDVCYYVAIYKVEL